MKEYKCKCGAVVNDLKPPSWDAEMGRTGPEKNAFYQDYIVVHTEESCELRLVPKDVGQVRTFDTGANRDVDTGKSNFVGCLDPAVLSAFARYMESCSHLPDGTVRDAGNWKKGMPTKSYMESLMRHVVDLWLLYEGHTVNRPETGKKVTLEDALGGAMFNIQGLWRNHLRG